MKRLLWIFVAISVVSIGVGAYMWNKPVASTKSAKTDASLSASELLSAFEESEENANTIYLGKVLEVTGEVMSADISDDGGIQVILEAGGLLGGVSCVMSDDVQLEGSPDALKGRTVTVKGNCTGYLMEVVLERCIILSMK